jgi:hypothetical protein
MALLGISCAHPTKNCSYRYTRGGLEVCAQTKQQPNFNEIDDILVGLDMALAERGFIDPLMRDALNDLKAWAVITDKGLAYNCKEYQQDSRVRLCDMLLGGVIIHDNGVLVSNDDCLYETALAHELLHVLRGIYMGDTDNVHSDPLWWGPGEGSVERRAAAHRSYGCPG